MTRSLQEDLDSILQSGINHTGAVIQLLMERGWTSNDVLPAIYSALLNSRVDPKGNQTPYKTN